MFLTPIVWVARKVNDFLKNHVHSDCVRKSRRYSDNLVSGEIRRHLVNKHGGSAVVWLVVVQPRHWPSLFGIMSFRVSPLHVDIVIDLNAKATSSNVSHERFTLLKYTTVGTWSHRLPFILYWLTPRNKWNENIVVLILLVKENMLTTRSCRRKSHSQLLVSEMFSSGTNSTYSNCDFLMYIHENDQD